MTLRSSQTGGTSLLFEKPGLSSGLLLTVDQIDSLTLAGGMAIVAGFAWQASKFTLRPFAKRGSGVTDFCGNVLNGLG